MGPAGSVAGFTAKAGFGVERLEAGGGGRMHGVAAEAGTSVLRAERLTKGSGQGGVWVAAESGGGIEGMEPAVESDFALEPAPFGLVEESTAELARAKDPIQFVSELAGSGVHGVVDTAGRGGK